jgi:hypothetical protein
MYPHWENAKGRRRMRGFSIDSVILMAARSTPCSLVDSWLINGCCPHTWSWNGPLALERELVH